MNEEYHISNEKTILSVQIVQQREVSEIRWDGVTVVSWSLSTHID